jgi:RNA polymerase sigma-70 factor (ECF subfamily)
VDQYDASHAGYGAAYDPEMTTALAVASPVDRRAEFGAHLEASYPRLVSQMCMITLDAGQAHELVQDAYARAWQRWSTVRELPDPTGWVRQLAVRSSSRRWRRLLKRRPSRPVSAGAQDPAHLAVLEALGTLTPYRRRALVLRDVAHLPPAEVARVEGIAPAVAEDRVTRAREELAEALAARPAIDPAASAAWEDM